MSDAPAGALFLARAQAAEPTFELMDGNAGTVAELCRRLDGIPLAIELAAARVRAMAPSDLLARFDQRFRVLTGGPHREGGRHRTLHAVVDSSYELFDEAEALLFERLSVFAGLFTLTAAERVCAGRQVRVPARDGRHDRRVSEDEVADSVDTPSGVDDRPRRDGVPSDRSRRGGGRSSREGSSLCRAASTHPAEPAPITSTS